MDPRYGPAGGSAVCRRVYGRNQAMVIISGFQQWGVLFLQWSWNRKKGLIYGA
jgi:hypothetical protein